MSEVRVSTADAVRAAALRRMKLVATLLLAGMAVIFVVAFALEDAYPWIAYVRAAAEGGMVGAIADWFAVTALFRHPLGLKIPHTAIIPRRKDQIGASLGDFVEENFLAEDVVEGKIRSLGIAEKSGQWLSRPANADRVAREGAAAIRAAFTVLDDQTVQDVLESLFRRHVLAPPWGPPVGRLAENVFDDGHHHRLVDLLVDRAEEWMSENHDVVTGLVTERKPQWVPGFVDGFVGERVYTELSRFIRAVQRDPEHQVRQSIDSWLKTLAQDLQYDPAVIARAEGIKDQLANDPRVTDLVSRTWSSIKDTLLDAVSDPDSGLSRNFTAAVLDFGQRLATDEPLAAKVNSWISDGTVYLVRTYRSDIASVISETVERWDGVETSRKIELQVGRDLQFIRINGTVVGAIAGLVIFSLAHAVFG